MYKYFFEFWHGYLTLLTYKFIFSIINILPPFYVYFSGTFFWLGGPRKNCALGLNFIKSGPASSEFSSHGYVYFFRPVRRPEKRFQFRRCTCTIIIRYRVVCDRRRKNFLFWKTSKKKKREVQKKKKENNITRVQVCIFTRKSIDTMYNCIYIRRGGRFARIFGWQQPPSGPYAGRSVASVYVSACIQYLYNTYAINYANGIVFRKK